MPALCIGLGDSEGEKEDDGMSFQITAGQREYFRHRGVSAEVERRGLGSSQPELAWATRQKQGESGNGVVDVAEPPKSVGSNSFDPQN
jgi:hypothetical protein